MRDISNYMKNKGKKPFTNGFRYQGFRDYPNMRKDYPRVKKDYFRSRETDKKEVIHLVGNVNLMRLKPQRTPGEMKMDTIPEEKIVYSDLVFSLKQDPTSERCFRVGVNKEGEDLLVVVNPLYYSAQKEAGVDPVYFDFIPSKDSFPGLKWITERGIEPIQNILERPNTRLFLFFKETPKREIDLSNLDIKGSEKNKSKEYKTHNCLEYTIKTQKPEEKSILLKKAYKLNGPLRSINGVIQDGLYDIFE